MINCNMSTYLVHVPFCTPNTLVMCELVSILWIPRLTEATIANLISRSVRLEGSMSLVGPVGVNIRAKSTSGCTLERVR